MFEHSTLVPLFLRVPGCAPRVLEAPVSTLRVVPTLARLGGARLGGPTIDGVPREAPIVSEAIFTADGVFLRAVVLGPHKLIVDVRNGGRMLFDLRRGEDDDLYASDAVARDRMESAYQRWLDWRR